jgi:o-succinylbenzoate synthase
MSSAAAIDEAFVSPYRVELASAAPAGRNRVDERRGAILRVRAGAALGVGEAAPLPGYSPDRYEETLEALRRFAGEIARAPVDREAPALEVASSLAARIPAHLPAARFAAETALLDALGQLAGLPVRALLAEPTHLPRALPVAALVELDDPDPALRAVDAGYRALKIKIGLAGAFDREVEALCALRRAIGDEIELRADANGTLRPDDAAALDRLAPAGLAFVEEPVPGRALPSLAPGPVPIALDESLREPDIWTLLPAGRQLAAVVLKPACLGGLSPCVALASKARRHGANAIVSHLFGGVIERAACAELALALASASSARPAAGLGAHPGLAPFAPARELCGRGPELVGGDWPGLGIIAREALP